MSLLTFKSVSFQEWPKYTRNEQFGATSNTPSLYHGSRPCLTRPAGTILRHYLPDDISPPHPVTAPTTPKRFGSAAISVLAVLMTLAGTPDSRAQSTNAEILQQLAVGCLPPDATSFRGLTVRSDRQHSFLDQAIVGSLANRGLDVYLEAGVDHDSTSNPAHTAFLTYFVREAVVRYERKGRRRISREIALEMGYILQDSTGRVAADSTCADAYSDEILRTQLDAVESESIPVTRGERPRGSWIRRYAEPVIVGAATAVAVYLFFNVRSDANDSP